MEEREKTYRVGLFVFVSLFILIFGHLWLSRFEMGRKGVVITVLFDDISGLKLGDPVYVFGVNKGKVISIRMLERQVEVKLWVSKDVDLREDTRVSIKDVAMISGTKCIILDPGVSPRPLDPSKPIKGEPSWGLTTVEIGKLADQIGRMVDFVKKGFGEGGGLLDELRKTLVAIETILVENKKSIGKTIEESREDLEKLGNLVTRLDSLVQDLEKGKGSAGKFLKDEELYNNLNLAAKKLVELIDDIKKNPQKYIKIDVKVF
ncbi:hypothetical protein DRQ16_02315 [bacterium]|nr:MAG: hypothetical protein DRQ16_02315 [bacterium]